MSLFTRTFLPAFVFALTLMGCQTVGIDEDPQRPLKITIAASAIAVDTVGAYGKLPDCGSGVGDMCRSPKSYASAKTISQTFVRGLSMTSGTPRSSIFLTAGLLYFQYELSKTITDAPAPTDPEADPTEAVRKKLEALEALDLLVSTADERVTAAASVNTTVAELLADLNARVLALP